MFLLISVIAALQARALVIRGMLNPLTLLRTSTHCYSTYFIHFTYIFI